MQESRDKGESSNYPGIPKSGRGNQSDVDSMQRKISSPMEETEIGRERENTSTNESPSAETDKLQTDPVLSAEGAMVSSSDSGILYGYGPTWSTVSEYCPTWSTVSEYCPTWSTVSEYCPAWPGWLSWSNKPVSDPDATRNDTKAKLDEEEAEKNQKNYETQSTEEDYVFANPTISDDWTTMMWKKSAFDLQVVTKSSYSCEWIKEVLESNIFGYRIDREAHKLEICRNKNHNSSASSRSSSVFCFEKDTWDSALLEVKALSSHLGMKNVIILLIDKTPDNRFPGQMKDGDDFPVLIFSKQQVTWYENNLKFYKRKLEEMERLVKGSAPWKGHKIGIFSRSSESDFEWLKTELNAGCFRDIVEDVRPCCISNRGFQQFMTDVSNCRFGILYHTKNRGRINITDVTDSLYDEELQYMSGMLDKRVIVVVDDLQNGNDEEKSRIQSSQPTIGKSALDLFLFTTDEKKFLEPLVKMRNLINGESE